MNCWYIKTTQRNLGIGQRNQWAKSKNLKEKIVESETESAPLEITNQVEDFVTLVETNVLNTFSVDTPVGDKFVDEAQTKNVDVPVTEDKVDAPVESDGASEISVEIETKTERIVLDYVVVLDAVKSHVRRIVVSIKFLVFWDIENNGISGQEQWDLNVK